MKSISVGIPDTAYSSPSLITPVKMRTISSASMLTMESMSRRVESPLVKINLKRTKNAILTISWLSNDVLKYDESKHEWTTTLKEIYLTDTFPQYHCTPPPQNSIKKVVRILPSTQGGGVRLQAALRCETCGLSEKEMEGDHTLLRDYK